MFVSNVVKVVSLLFVSGLAIASIPGLEQAYTRHINTSRAAIESTQALQTPRPSTCHSQVLNLSDDGQISIFMGFGYMDVTAGQDFSDSGSNLYSNGHVLDGDAKEAMENMLVSRCSGNSYTVCGFSKRGNTFTKRIRDRFTNQRVQVRITLQSASVTGSDAENRGRYAARQERSSAQARAEFMQAAQTHDVVIYMGHARSGGGPDFYPPVLTSSGHVNYSHYRQEQDGIRGLVSSLRQAGRSPKVIGLLACKSTGLFAQRVRNVAPESILVTAGDLFDYNDILPTGYAMLEAIVSQRCTDDFERVVKIQRGSSPFLRIFF